MEKHLEEGGAGHPRQRIRSLSDGCLEKHLKEGEAGPPREPRRRTVMQRSRHTVHLGFLAGMDSGDASVTIIELLQLIKMEANR